MGGDKSAALQDATANSQELRKYSPFSGVGIPQEQLDEVGRSFKKSIYPRVKGTASQRFTNALTGNFHEIGSPVRR